MTRLTLSADFGASEKNVARHICLQMFVPEEHVVAKFMFAYQERVSEALSSSKS